MIWALLITMLIKMIAGPEQLFTVPKLDKEIKTHISDKEQKKELLSIVKTAKKEIKAFNKETDKAKKKLKKLTSSRDDELDEIKTLFDDIKLEWPESRDEMARDRSKKAKSLSIKNQLFGSKTKPKSSRSHTAKKPKTGLRKKPKSVQSKVKKKR